MAHRTTAPVGAAVMLSTLALISGCGGGGGGGGGATPAAPNALLTSKVFDPAVAVDDPTLGTVAHLAAWFVPGSTPTAEVVICQEAIALTEVVVDGVDFETNGTAPDTVSAASADFIAAGFRAGGEVRVGGLLAPNDAFNGEYRLRAVTTTTLVIDPLIGEPLPGDLLAQDDVSLTPVGGDAQVFGRTWTEQGGLGASFETLFDGTGLAVVDCAIEAPITGAAAVLRIVTRAIDPAAPDDLSRDLFTVRLIPYDLAAGAWALGDALTIADQPTSLGEARFAVGLAFRGDEPNAFFVEGAGGADPLDGFGDALRAVYDGTQWTTTTLFAAGADEAAAIEGAFVDAAHGGYLLITTTVASSTFDGQVVAFDATAATPGFQAPQALWADEVDIPELDFAFGLDGGLVGLFALSSASTTLRWRSYDAGAATWSAEGQAATPGGLPVRADSLQTGAAPAGAPGLVAAIDGAHFFFQEDDSTATTTPVFPLHGARYDEASNTFAFEALDTGSIDAVIAFQPIAELDGDAHVTIAQDDTGGPALFHLFYDAALDLWAPLGAATALDEGGAGLTFPGEVWAFDTRRGLGTGDGLVVIQELRSGDDRLFVAPWDAATATFDLPSEDQGLFSLGLPVGSDRFPEVRLDLGGNSLLVWVNRDASTSRVLARFRAGGVFDADPTQLFLETSGTEEVEALDLVEDVRFDPAAAALRGTFTQLIFIRYRADDFRRFDLVALRNP